jgi:signal transduction histidine kinase
MKPVRAALITPIAVGSHLLGVLLVGTDQPGTLTEVDREMASTFADRAALAIEFERAQHDRQQLAVYQDRDRIARDLHDLVIQRLFAVALGLQALVARIPDAESRERVHASVSDLDQTIADIRQTIFSLQDVPEPGDQVSLRSQLLHAVREPAAALGFEPRLSFDGPIDSLVPDPVRADLLATLREALSNVVRHASAGKVRVGVEVDRAGRRLSLQVRDDGVGIEPHAGRGHGLDNMTDRAQRWAGTCTIETTPNEGTTLCWSIILPAGQETM